MEMNDGRFSPGDLVQVKQEILCRPIMVVGDVIFEQKKLMGILCWWFDVSYGYQEAMFNTKDLMYAKTE